VDHDLSDSDDAWDETQQPMDEDGLVGAAVESAAGPLNATVFDINKAGLHEVIYLFLLNNKKNQK
jgi:hypothetical protein